MQCTRCGSKNFILKGTRGSRQRVKCKKCGKWDTTPLQQNRIVPPAKILLFDIETLPIVTYTWSLREDYISPNYIIKDWCVLSWAAKWLYSPDVMGDVLSSQEAVDRDDIGILEQMWQLLDEADIVIGHNSRRFDHKKLNTRFLLHNRLPPSFYKTIDTLSVAKAHMAWSSNKLDYINKCLGIHQKQETDMDLWKSCDVGDRKSLRRMLEYNKNDVAILEELYVKFRPWIPNHPSMKSYVEKDVDICPCGNTELEWVEKPYRTNVAAYNAWRCPACGSIGRSSKSNRRK